MGFLKSLKDAIMLDEDDEDEDELYEKEMKAMERSERAKSSERTSSRSSSFVSRRNRNVEENTELDDFEDEMNMTPGKAAQERRKKSGEDKYSQAFRPQTPPKSPESSYSEYASQFMKKYKKTQDASEIEMYKAKTFSDAQIICDSLTSGSAIIVNFDEISEEDSQRIMDFICGCIYVMQGKIHAVSDKIFLFSPNDIDVSGDFMNLVQKDKFGVPTFTNK